MTRPPGSNFGFGGLGTPATPRERMRRTRRVKIVKLAIARANRATALERQIGPLPMPSDDE